MDNALKYTNVQRKDGRLELLDPGCGCCGGDITATPEMLRAWITELELMLEEARRQLAAEEPTA